MSLVEVARKDLLGARRTKSLWAVLSVLGGIGVLFGYAIVTGGDGGASDPTTVRSAFTDILRTVAFLASAVIPIVALIVGYQAIAGERDSGGLAFLLSLPNSRRDVFFGKLLSRALLVTAGTLLLFLTVFAALVGDIVVSNAPLAVPVWRVTGIVAASVVYAVTFVVIAVTVSSLFASRRRAVGGAIGAYFLTVVSYLLPIVSVSGIVRALHADVLGFSPNPELYAFVNYTSPFIAFRKLLNLVLPADAAFSPLGAHGSATPWFFSDAFALVVFAAWLSVPVAAGYLRFRQADLG